MPCAEPEECENQTLHASVTDWTLASVAKTKELFRHTCIDTQAYLCTVVSRTKTRAFSRCSAGAFVVAKDTADFGTLV